MKKIERILSVLLLAVATALVGCGEKYDYKQLGFDNVEEMKQAHAAGYHNKSKYIEMTEPKQIAAVETQKYTIATPESTSNSSATSDATKPTDSSNEVYSEDSSHVGSIEQDDAYLNDSTFGPNIQTVKKALDAAKSGSKEDVERHLTSIKITKDSNLPKPRNRKKARQLNEEALVKLGAGNVEESVDLLLKAYEEDPLDPEIAANVAAAALQLKDYRLVELFSYHALAINPRKTTVWFPYGLAKYAMGQKREAFLAAQVAWLYSSNQQKTLSYLQSKYDQSSEDMKEYFSKLISWFKDGISPL